MGAAQRWLCLTVLVACTSGSDAAPRSDAGPRAVAADAAPAAPSAADAGPCEPPQQGCPCAAGTPAAFCAPEPLEVPRGTLENEEGSRACLPDGVWGPCATTADPVFVPADGSTEPLFGGDCSEVALQWYEALPLEGRRDCEVDEDCVLVSNEAHCPDGGPRFTSCGLSLAVAAERAAAYEVDRARLEAALCASGVATDCVAASSCPADLQAYCDDGDCRERSAAGAEASPDAGSAP